MARPVSIVCSDRGQHLTRQLGLVEWSPASPLGASYVTELAGRRLKPDKQGRPRETRRPTNQVRDEDGGRWYAYRCQSCSRSWNFKPTTLRGYIEKIVRAKVSELDLSKFDVL